MKKSSQSKMKVLFDASVVIAGLYSPNGGSGKLLQWVKQQRIEGVISETIFDEIVLHAEKISFKPTELITTVQILFPYINTAPDQTMVQEYGSIVFDVGDAHVLASAIELSCTHLVTLDKKHLLVLKNKFKKIQIVSPKELIEILN